MPLNTANSHILEENAQEEKGEHARLSSFIGALAITDLIKTTLGPKGMDKILQSTSERGETQVTNDGATILKSIHIDNPAAKILVETSKIQDDQVGDGTTSVCVLSGELLREAEQLLAKNIHPQIIISGWRKAQEISLKALESIAFNNLSDPVKLRHDLLNIAKTTLSSKILSQEKEHFANLAVDAVLRLKGSTNLDSIHIIKKSGGSLRDSYLDEGYILEKKIGVGQPKRLENAKILVANTAMDTDKIKIYGAKVKAESPQEIANIEASERERMLQKCEQIAKHGINCFINRQLIYNLPEQYFTDHGIMAIEHADFEGIERLALVLGSEIVSTFDNPELVKLGSCKLIEEIIIGEDRFIKFSGVAVGSACTIVLRGSSTHLLDEAERSLHDALSVLSQIATEPKVVYGGGCAEVHMAKHVDQQAALTAGKESIALEAYARALRAIPTIIANNGGYDSAQLVSELRAAHNNGNHRAGLDMDNGKVEDMEKIEIYDSWKVKRNIITAASETAELILRADAIFKAAPRKRE